MKIMFMGTPDIAALTLERLLADGHNVTSVITGEDKPRGRGKVLTPTRVKKTALDRAVRVYTPESLRTDGFYEILCREAPDIIVVVAYGKILPKSVIDYPKYGCINMHVSLLPKYRGAAPMQRAIIDGEEQTGVTIMYMDEGLDTGDIIDTVTFPIGETDDFEAIHDRSAELGADLLSRTLPKIENGTAKRTPQDPALATYAKKIEKNDAKIDFTKSARELDCLIRGVTPIPGAYAMHNGELLKIARAVPAEGTGTPGQVIATDSKGEGSFTVAVGGGALKVLSVIPVGKGKMSAGDFVRGRKIALGDILE